MPVPTRARRARPLLSAAIAATLAAAPLALAAPDAEAFCGFFVGKADATLGNRSSQVIVARHEQKTVISMLNEYRGALKEFALVVPVPQVLERGQINVGDRKTFDRIDAFTAPRLAEYHDPDPCVAPRRHDLAPASAPLAASMRGRRKRTSPTRRSASPSRRATRSASTRS